MFHSKVSKYNVYDATPFHRDPIAELAAACKRKSHARWVFTTRRRKDWHEPGCNGNTWDFDRPKRTLTNICTRKRSRKGSRIALELRPGRADLVSIRRVFITEAQSKELADVVHSCSPSAWWNGRIGNDKGDYRSTGDNENSVKVSTTTGKRRSRRMTRGIQDGRH